MSEKSEALHSLDQVLSDIEAGKEVSDEVLAAVAFPSGPPVNDPPKNTQQDVNAAVADSAPSGAPTGEVAGVLTKDGKHVIPYSALEKERREAQEAKAKAEENARQLETLKSALSLLNGAKPADQQAASSPANDGAAWEAQLASIREIMPDVAAVLEQGALTMRQQQEALQMLLAERDAAQQASATSLQAEMHAALEANPVLMHLQATDPTGWERAKMLDNALRQDPDVKDMSFAERFAKVSAAYESIYGAVSIPGIQTSTEQPQVKQPAAKPVVPVSISQIPGGAAAPVDQASALREKSGQELTNHFMSMTPDQIEKALSQLV